MRQPRLFHQLGDADAAQPLLAQGSGRGLDDPPMGRRFTIFRLGHCRHSHMMTII